MKTKKKRVKMKKKQVVTKVPGIKDKEMMTLKHNLNLHLRQFKNDTDFKMYPKRKFRLIYLFDKLKDEEKIGKKIGNIIDTKWRDKMRKSKLSSLKVEFINTIEFKDIELKYQQKRLVKLDSELNECNDVSIHMEKNVSFEFKAKIIENLKETISVLKVNYTKQVELIKNQFDDEINVLKDVHFKRVNQIQCYINVIEDEYLNELKHLDAHFKQLKDEETTNHKNEMISLKLYYEKQANSLQNKIKVLMNDYEREQKQSLNKYIELSKIVQKAEELFLKDKLYYDNRLSLFKSLKNQCVHVDILGVKKDNFKEMKKKWEEKLNELSENRDRMKKKLKLLSKFTSEAINILKKKQLKAEKIVKMIKSCSELEFFKTNLDLYQNYENLSCTPFINIFTEHSYLVNLYKKYNYSQLNVKALTIERDKLLSENENLKEQLKNYFHNFKVPSFKLE